MSDRSDRHLLRAYLKGDREAFDALYRRYAARVYVTAFRLTGRAEEAEDALQDVFVTLARKARAIRKGQALSSWIYRVTVNRATDALRRRRRESSLDLSRPEAERVILFESVRREAERNDRQRREELLDRVQAFIPQLPDRQAAVFVLRHFQGLRHREIAETLGCAVSTSKSLHSIACRTLRGWIARQEQRELEGKRGEEAP